MPQPPPAVGETNRFGETWNGSRWLLADPAGQHTPEPWNDDDSKYSASALKNFLTVGGATAGSLLGPAGTIAGGAIGRTVGHIPEALLSHTIGRDVGGSFLTDPVEGAIEGGAMELGSRIAGPAVRLAGKAMGGTARAIETLTGGRVASPFLRGAIGYGVGHTPGAVIAEAGPPLLKAAGAGAESAGDWLGSRPLGDRVRGVMEGLARRLNPAEEAVSYRPNLAAGAERYSAQKAAAAEQVAAAERASGMGPDLGETVTVNTRGTMPASPTYGAYVGRNTEPIDITEQVRRGVQNDFRGPVSFAKPEESAAMSALKQATDTRYRELMDRFGGTADEDPSVAFARRFGLPTNDETAAILAARKKPK